MRSVLDVEKYDELVDGIHGATGHIGDADHLNPCRHAAAVHSVRRLVTDVATSLFGEEMMAVVKDNISRYARGTCGSLT